MIANAYEAWGAECVHPFRGMFAFLIWDVREQKLFAARRPLRPALDDVFSTRSIERRGLFNTAEARRL